jgi:hypothetical protein
MKIKDLKEWLESLPKEYHEYDLVFRNFKLSDVADHLLAHDEPIVACAIDITNNEAYFCNEESYQLIKQED